MNFAQTDLARLRTPAALLAAALLLGGCATAAIDENYAAVRQFGIEQGGGEARWLRNEAERAEMAATVDELLAEPLDADGAVRIALGYSPAFQALLADAAAASAEATRSARVPNPVFSFERLVRGSGAERELDIGRALSVSLLDILFLPARLERAEARQQQTRLQASAMLLQTVTEVRQAWVSAVAAASLARHNDELAEATAAGAELARRMQAAGNFSRLQRARLQALHAEAVGNRIRARQHAVAAREALVQKLGLTAAQASALRLPEDLPELPAAPLDEVAVARSALDERLDVRLARAELEWTARDLGLTRVTSVVNALHLTGVSNSETGEPRQRGFELKLPLPLFDFGDAARAGGEARYLAAFNRSAQIARAAVAQVRSGYHAYRGAHDLARHYRDEVVPLRQNIAEEALLQYNGMLIGVFDLLADARAERAATLQAVEAARDFWLAEAALKATLLGHSSAPVALQTSAVPAEAGGH